MTTPDNSSSEARERAKARLQKAFGPQLQVMSVSDKFAHLLAWLDDHPGSSMGDYPGPYA